MANPNEKVKNPRSTSTGENPTFKALKKKFFTGPRGNAPAKRYDNADPMIPPIIIPKIISPVLLFAITPPFCLTAKH